MLQKLSCLIRIKLKILYCPLTWFLGIFPLYFVCIILVSVIFIHFWIFWLWLLSKINTLISFIVLKFKIVFFIDKTVSLWIRIHRQLMTFGARGYISLIFLHKNLNIVIAVGWDLLIELGTSLSKLRKLINALIFFWPLLYHWSKLFQVLSMRLCAFGRCCLNLSIMSSSNTTSSFHILFGSVVSTPSAFHHFFKVFFHVFQLILNVDTFLFWVASFSLFLVTNLF